MIEFITENPTLIISIVLMIIFAATGQWLKLRSEALALFFWAQEKLPDLIGEEKMDEVVYKFYNKLPGFLNKFVSLETMRKLLQHFYDWGKKTIKDFLDDGVINNS